MPHYAYTPKDSRIPANPPARLLIVRLLSRLLTLEPDYYITLDRTQRAQARYMYRVLHLLSERRRCRGMPIVLQLAVVQVTLEIKRSHLEKCKNILGASECNYPNVKHYQNTNVRLKPKHHTEPNILCTRTHAAHTPACPPSRTASTFSASHPDSEPLSFSRSGQIPVHT